MRSKKNSEVLCILSTIFISLLSTFSINAQNIEWTRTFGGTGDDGAQSMVLTSDGGIVIAGFKSPGAYLYNDVLLMKTDASGNELWSQIYSPGLNDIGRALRQTTDGGFIIAGMTEVSPQIFDPFLIKTDSEGIVQWQQQYDYGLGDDDRGHAVWQTSDGGYILAGQTWLLHGAFGNYDIYVVKTDMNGNFQWKRVYYRENEGADVALSIQQLDDRGYIIGGFTQSSEWASYIIRTDSLGIIVWSNTYPGAWQSECYDIQSTPDGGFIYTGTESSFTTDTDVLLAKLDGNGNLLWKKIFGSVDADQGESIQQLSDGGFTVAGMSAGGGNGYDMYVLRTNSNGDLLWSSIIGGSGDDRAFSVATAQDGSHLVSGWTWSYGQGLGDVYLVKLQDSVIPVELTSFSADVSGEDIILRWSTATELNNSGFEIQRKSGTEEWNGIGFIQGSATTQQTHNYSYTDHFISTGKYSYRLKQIDYDGSYTYSDAVEVEMNNIPSRFSLEQNYPNPFNPATTISFSIPSSVHTSLKVYDILGNEVASLINEERPAGNYHLIFNSAELSSGTYFYKLQAGSFSETKKMVLIK